MNAQGWREVATPDRFELYDWMVWLAEHYGEDVSQMYKWYWDSD